MNKKSLSWKLSLNILLMAIPIFVLSLGILFLQSRKLIRQEAIERVNSILNTTLQHVRNFMCTVETSTNANAWLVEENFQPDSLQSISNRIVYLNRNVNGCSISTEPDVFPQCGRYFSVYSINEGDTVITVRESEYDYFDKVWYKTALKAGKAGWVDPFDDFTEGTLNPSETIASYCRPLRQKNGQIVGVISTDLSFNRLTETISAVKHPYRNAYFMLLGGDGRYFIHPDSTRLFRKTIFTDTDPTRNADQITLGHEMTAGKKGTMEVSVNGKRCYVCYRPVPNTDWSLALVCPESDMLRSYHLLAYLVTILIVLGLLAISWLCYLVVRKTISPLNKLLRSSQKIAAGNYDEIILPTNREDVIGQLQNSFAAMQQSLNFHMGSIRHTAEKTRQSNEELVHAMQLAKEAVKQKNLFIQNVSHQIRTPLNIILGFANVLRENVASYQDNTNAQDALQKEDVTNIATTMKYNAVHLNRMVLMLFDSSETGASEEFITHKDDCVSCNKLAHECISYMKDHFPGVAIHFHTSLPDEFSIRTNYLYLWRTLCELLYNSAKYSDGKHISLSVSQTDGPDEQGQGTGTVRFTVEDVGPGLPENLQDMIFKPFAKVDDLTEGLGLGLPLSKRHALSLGGDLILDTSYHDGCRFTLVIPK